MPENQVKAAAEVPAVPKAFDFNELLKELAKANAPVLIDWTSKGCMASENAIVKVAGAVLVASKPAILAEVAKL